MVEPLNTLPSCLPPLSQMSASPAPRNRRDGRTAAGRVASAPVIAPAAYHLLGLDVRSLTQPLEPIANGLVGGLIAGAFAISLYLANKRSAARGGKFTRARALCVELDYIRKTLPDTSLGRFTTSPLYHLGKIKGGRLEHSDFGRPLPSSGIASADIHGSVYRGLVNSGGISIFEASLQERLYGLYDHFVRGGYDMVHEQVLPMMKEVARFMDENAPLAPRARMRRAGSTMLVSLRRRHKSRRRA